MTDTKELRKLAEECLVDQPNLQLMELRAKTVIALLDTIEAQAAEIEELKASTITHCEWYAARNQITHQAALLKQCKGVLDYYKYDPMTEHARLHEALAAIEQWENGK